MKFSIASYATLLFMKITFWPNTDLLAWVFIAMALDFITGVAKAKVQKVQRTSTGFRKTIIKALQYIGLIVGCFIMSNALPDQAAIITYINNGMLVFIIYIELTSIFENLYELNPDSLISQRIFKWVLTILKIGLEKNVPPEITNTTIN